MPKYLLHDHKYSITGVNLCGDADKAQAGAPLVFERAPALITVTAQGTGRQSDCAQHTQQC